jgi:DAK2 domain fusion protein YloV
MGARGNSGVILSQLLRGMADHVETEYRDATAERTPRPAGAVLARALRRAADEAYEAVARPVEGTMLTVARAAAEGAEHAAQAAGGGITAVVRGAARAAREALVRTPDQLDVLRRAGVVDAGGRGLCVLFDALVSVVTGERPPRSPHVPVPLRDEPDTACAETAPAPGFEVIYLLDAPDHTIPALRTRLDRLGDSLVVVGGEGLWNVHVHVDDAGAAVEAGIEAGRPHRIRITHLAASPAVAAHQHVLAVTGRAIVAVVQGEGLATLFTQAGAHIVETGPGRAPSTGTLLDAIRATAAREVVLLPNDPDGHAVAGVAAEQAALAYGIRVQVVPTKAAVQGIAALAVHEPGRRFEQDVVGMTSAAGATRYGALTTATREAWTMAGVCQAGDILGIIDGDIAVIGHDLAATARTVLDRMLAGGGELVTLVTGAHLDPGLADTLLVGVRQGRPEVDAVVYDGGQSVYPLLIGVE